MRLFFCGRVLLVFGIDDGRKENPFFEMLDGTLFDDDEIEIHRGDCWKHFVDAFSWFVG